MYLGDYARKVATAHDQLSAAFIVSRLGIPDFHFCSRASESSITARTPSYTGAPVLWGAS